MTFGRRHRGAFYGGVAAAVGVVTLRVLLPWPLKEILTPMLASGSSGGALEWTPVLLSGGVFILIAVLLGLADLTERLQFARFSISTVRDMRSAAFESACRLNDDQTESGDLVARLIGDTARIKAGLKGFLIHVATNVLLLVSVTAILLWLYLPMGFVFGGACLALLGVTVIGAASMYRTASRYRTKEGQLAEHIHETLAGDSGRAAAFAEVNDSSSLAEASLTHTQGRATWAAHAIFGFAAIGAVALGAHGVSIGRLETGTLVAIAMYAVMLRAPMIQLVRQGTRTGRILASVSRVAHLLETDPGLSETPRATLTDAIVLDNIKLVARKALGKKRAVRVDHLEIPAGQRLGVIGPGASGKSALLRLLGGIDIPSRGVIFWDGAAVTGDDAQSRPDAAYASSEMTWPRKSLSDVLGVTGDGQRESVALKIMEALGGKCLLRCLQDGTATRLSSSECSLGERTCISIARAVASRAPVVLIDDACADGSRAAAERRVEMILNACEGRTVVVACRRSSMGILFDRAIHLRSGRVVFDSQFDESDLLPSLAGGPEVMEAEREVR